MLFRSFFCASATARADSVTGALARSYRLEARGKHAAAARALSNATPTRRLDRYFVLLRQGWLRYRARDYSGAISAYRSAARVAPDAVEPLLGLLLPQMAARRWRDALGTARACLRKAPGNRIATRRRAYILFNLGRYRAAARIYRYVLQRYPSDLEMQRGLAWSLLRDGQRGAAKRAFARLLRLSPSDSSAKRGLRLASR